MIRFAYPTGSHWLSISASLRFGEPLPSLYVRGTDEIGIGVDVEAAVFPCEELEDFMVAEEWNDGVTIPCVRPNGHCIPTCRRDSIRANLPPRFGFYALVEAPVEGKSDRENSSRR